MTAQTHIGSYTLHKRLGGGISGNVWSGGDGDRPTVAVKVFNADDDITFRNEVKVLLRANALGSPYIIKCVHAGLHADLLEHGVGLTPYIAFELHGPALNRILDADMSIPDVKSLARCLFGGLSALHRAGIVHSDIKPENILSRAGDPAHFVITDFGTSVYKGERTTDTVGTSEYFAPEVVLEQLWGTPYDIWSAHAVIYAALTRVPLFDVYDLYDVSYGDDVDGMEIDGVELDDDADASDPSALAARLLTLMVKVIGPMPNPRRARRYLDADGYPLTGRVEQIGVLALLLQMRPMDDDMSTATLAANFIMSGLQWNPAARPTADSALTHPWLE